jgi:class 3 adenylate cyclase/tetratricopeptide (TPR) repeat protein
MAPVRVLVREGDVADPPQGTVTLLATDIVGSVELWQRDETAMSAALAHHDQILRETVRGFGGRVIKGSGDGVWSAFEQPAEALHSALAIQKTIQATEWGEIGELRVRVAVHSGGAELRDGDYFGPTANRLARLVERVRAGGILVSQDTLLLAGVDDSSGFVLRSVGELRLRNLREPLHAFQILVPGDRGDTDADSLFGATTFIPSYSFPSPGRLVGRAPELATLWDALERGREAETVVLISAPAGTGKSTLVGELVRRAQAAGVLCLAGGAYEQAGVIPLGPVRDALADFLLSQPEDPLYPPQAEVLADLSAMIPELTYQLEHGRRSDGSLDLGRVSGAVFACLRALAARQPVLLCLEDLHNADDGTLKVVHHLVRQASKLPLTLFATFRGEDVQPGQELGRLIAALIRDGATRIDLASFDRDETGQLIASLLDGPASERLRDSLYASTEGNPLFVEQSVHALREQGQIGRAGHVWYDTGDIDLSLSTVQRDLFDQRLSRLSPRCYATVRMAAVLGHAFEYRALKEAVAPPDVESLVEDLEEATQAHVLREVPDGYAFTHALLRKAVYDSLLTSRLELLHGRAGEALERLAGARASEYAAELGHHFFNAGTDTRLQAKALRYSLEAGRRSASMMLHHEVLQQFSRVCELINHADVAIDLETHLEVLEGRQTAERALGRWDQVVETSERILSLAHDPLLRARTGSFISDARQRVGDFAAAEDACDSALAELDGIAEQTDTAPARLQLLSDKTYLLFLQGRYEEQAAIGAEMLPIARAIGTPRALQNAHNAVALSAMGRGQVEEGLAHFEQFLTAVERSNDRLSQALAHSNLGIQYQFAGDYGPARTEFERALELRRDLGAEVRSVNTIQRLGWVALGEGDLDKATELGEYASDLAIRASDRWAADCYDLLGTISTVKAEWSAAIKHFEQALRIREHGTHVVGRVDTLLGLGTVHQQMGDMCSARQHFADALVVASSIDPSPWLVAARRQLGQLHCLLGESQGPELVRGALELARTMPRSIEYGPTLLAAVQAGCWDAVETSAMRALERALDCGLTVVVRLEVLCSLARLQIEDGDLEAARVQIGEAEALAARLQAPRPRCLVAEAAALAAVAMGDRVAAREGYEQGLRYARSAGLPHEASRLASSLADLNLTGTLIPWEPLSVHSRA